MNPRQMTALVIPAGQGRSAFPWTRPPTARTSSRQGTPRIEGARGYSSSEAEVCQDALVRSGRARAHATQTRVAWVLDLKLPWGVSEPTDL